MTPFLILLTGIAAAAATPLALEAYGWRLAVVTAFLSIAAGIELFGWYMDSIDETQGRQ